jgi:hypothetical protein
MNLFPLKPKKSHRKYAPPTTGGVDQTKAQKIHVGLMSIAHHFEKKHMASILDPFIIFVFEFRPWTVGVILSGPTPKCHSIFFCPLIGTALYGSRTNRNLIYSNAIQNKFTGGFEFYRNTKNKSPQ